MENGIRGPEDKTLPGVWLTNARQRFSRYQIWLKRILLLPIPTWHYQSLAERSVWEGMYVTAANFQRHASQQVMVLYGVT